MGGPEMAPHTPQPLLAPRRSRGAPRPPPAPPAPAEPRPASTPTTPARLAPHPLVPPRRSRGAPRPPHARGAPAKPWHPSILRLLRHPDGLDVDELADAVLRELASVA